MKPAKLHGYTLGLKGGFEYDVTAAYPEWIKHLKDVITAAEMHAETTVAQQTEIRRLEGELAEARVLLGTAKTALEAGKALIEESETRYSNLYFAHAELTALAAGMFTALGHVADENRNSESLTATVRTAISDYRKWGAM